MSEYFLLYLFSKLDTFQAFFVGGALLSTMVFIALLTDLEQENVQKNKPRIAFAKVAFFVCVVLAVLVPNQKEAAMIVGGKMAIDIAKSEAVTDLSKKIFAVVNKKLDEAAK